MKPYVLLFRALLGTFIASVAVGLMVLGLFFVWLVTLPYLLIHKEVGQ